MGPSFTGAVKLYRVPSPALPELAGFIPLRVEPFGRWSAAWQTWRDAAAEINTHGLEARQARESVRLCAHGDYRWHSDLRLSDRCLTENFRTIEYGQPARGSLATAANGEAAPGRWTGFTAEGLRGAGWGMFGRAQSRASDIVKQSIHDLAVITEWPIQLAGVR